MVRTLNEQENFWSKDFGTNYIERNKNFDFNIAERGWREMLKSAENITSILEAGSSIGRNLMALKKLYPKAEINLIEINESAYDIAVKNVQPKTSYNGAILNSAFKEEFDLTFSCGVMIHINPQELKENLGKLFQYSNKYILLCEYFNRTPVSIEYHGENDKLFKRDFGKYFIENFNAEVLDYGFLWSYEYQLGGFDDMTWWLFRKK